VPAGRGHEASRLYRLWASRGDRCGRGLARCILGRLCFAVEIGRVHGGGSGFACCRLLVRCAGSVGLGRRAGGATILAVGQGVGVSGTDVVCAFGGPANQIGLACLHTSSTATSAYSFRIDETRLLVFRRAKGSTVQLGAWTEPASAIAQGHSAAVSNFTSVGQVSAGSQIDAKGTDLGCSVYTFKGTLQVACFKRNAKGILNGSYAVALGGATVQVSRFQNGHGTTVFVGKPPNR
jgi:hypothetical protein